MTEHHAPADRYGAALKWLLGFADWERGVGWNPAAAPDEQWKLGRTRALLDLAGAPDRALRIVLIAGTKGKGSTGAFLESIARAAGWRTGLYAQPHLHTYRERVKLDGRLVSREHFADLVDRLRGLVEALRDRHPDAGEPTTFELTTVLAILAFADHRADLAILEVGLGGRLDATNATDPVVSVITTIGYDHTAILGRTLGQIAAEKAGIVRPRGRVVSARQRPAAARAIRRRCAELGATLMVAPSLGPADPAELGLRGDHQRQNAAVALEVAQQLVAHGLPLTEAATRAGMASAWLPGRIERIEGDAHGPTVVLDAAHNRESALALAATLRDGGIARPLWFVIGILRDKDARAIVRPLAGLLGPGGGMVVSAPPSPRALPTADLLAACRAAGVRAVEVADTVAAALAGARQRAGSRGTVVVTGSFGNVAAARLALGLVRDDERDT